MKFSHILDQSTVCQNVAWQFLTHKMYVTMRGKLSEPHFDVSLISNPGENGLRNTMGQTCPTVFLHFMTFSLQLVTNDTLQCSSDNFPRMVIYMSWGYTLAEVRPRPRKRCNNLFTRTFFFKIPDLVHRRTSAPVAAGNRRQKSPLDGATDFLATIWQHITTVSFVSAFILVLTRKPKNASMRVWIGPKHNSVHFKSLCWCLPIDNWSCVQLVYAGKRL